MVARNSYFRNENIRTGRSNPCPICSNHKGDCKVSHDGTFVMCMDNHQEVNGWHFKGISNGGVWGMHSLVDVVLSQQERLERKLAKEKADQERLETLRKEALPVPDRDTAIRSIHKSIGLSQADKERLVKRGLSESQVEKYLAFSVRGATKVPDTIPSNLSGITIDYQGNKTLYAKDAFACSAFDFDGNAIGWQWRSNLAEGGRYFWAKGLKSSHLPNGELPITFVSASRVSDNDSETTVKQWLDTVDLEIDKDNLKILFATEGLLKPYVASCRLGVDTIGGAGFNLSNAKNQVRNIIKKGGYNCVVLPLDGGAVENTMVMNQLKKNVKLFESLECQVFIGWWHQLTKNDKDFDEIESLEQVRLVDYETVKSISKDLIYQKQKKFKLNQYQKFTADRIINKKRLLNDGETNDPELNLLVKNNTVIGIESPKNSGKTYWLKYVVEDWIRKGGKVLLPHLRRSLAQVLAKNLGLPNIDDALEERYSLNCIFERDRGLSFVVDSLLKLKYLDFSGCLVIFDEFKQFLSHLYDSGTAVKDNRAKILKLLDDILKTVVRTGGKIILLDADLTDECCNWVTKITGEQVFKLQNTQKAHNRNCYLYGNDKQGLDDLYQNIFADLANNIPVMLVSDCKNELEALELEVQKIYPKLRRELLTSETIGDPTVRAIIQNPDKCIKERKIKLLMGSPVIQSGISIDSAPFEKVYGIFNGVLVPSTALQLLARDRSDCDRHLWVSKRAKANYTNYFDYQDIQKTSFSADITQLCEYLETVDQNMSKKDILLQIHDMIDENDRLTDIHSITKAKLQAERNLLLSDYYQNMLEALENEGYVIKGSPNLTDQVTDIDIKANKEELLQRDAVGTNDADDIDIYEAEKLRKKHHRNKKEQYKLDKFFIKDTLPKLQLNPEFILEFILKDRWKTINAVKRFWFSQNPEIARTLDIKAIHYASKTALDGGQFWLEDIKSKCHYVKLFDRLNLLQLINDDLVIDKNSEVINSFFEGCKEYQTRKLLRSCGIKFINSGDRIELLKKVLKLYGHKLHCFKRTGKGADRVREYKIVRMLDQKLWVDLTDSFNFKYLNLEPIKYDFDIEKNDNYSEEFTDFIQYPENDQKEKSDGAGMLYQQGLYQYPTPLNIINKNTEATGYHSNPCLVMDSPPSAPNYSDGDLLSLNNQELIGKKCNFWGNNNQWLSGVIYKFIDCGIQLIADDGTVHYCDRTQIEMLDGSVFQDLPIVENEPVAIPEAVVKPVTENYYYHQETVIAVEYAPINLDELIPVANRKDVKIGDVLRSHKGIYSRIIAVDGSQICVEHNSDPFSIKYDTFELFRE